MKWIRTLGIAVVAGLAVVLVAGLATPAEHTARCRVRLAASPEDVWAILDDIRGWSDWNTAVERMEPTERATPETWTIVSEWGAMPLVVEAREAPRRLVTFVDGGEFEGRWEYSLAANGSSGTVLEITERGRLNSLLVRALGIFHDNHATIRTCMTDLAARLGEHATPENVR